MINIIHSRVLHFVALLGTTLLLLLPHSAQASESDWRRDQSQLEIRISKVAQQMAMYIVYIDGHLRQVFAVSTGAPGHRTPSGVFSVVRMHRMAYAPTYDNAPMPHSISSPALATPPMAPDT